MASWALPFEALYQTALADITAGTGDFTKLAIQLGPLGGAQPAARCSGPGSIAYVAGADRPGHSPHFRRQDL